jgi:hypothetical protein
MKDELHAVNLLRPEGSENQKEGSPEQIYFAGRAHTNLQSMVAAADQKATSFIAVFTIIGAVVGSSWLTNIWSAYRAMSGWQSAAMTMLGLATLGASVASIICSALVLKPRFPRAQDVSSPAEAPRLMWVADLRKYEQAPEEYLAALERLRPTGILADLAFDNIKISWILRQKYRWLNPSVYCLFAGILGWALVICVVIVKAKG